MGGAGVEAGDHPGGEVDVDAARGEIGAGGAVEIEMGRDVFAGVEGAVERLNGNPRLHGGLPHPNGIGKNGAAEVQDQQRFHARRPHG